MTAKPEKPPRHKGKNVKLCLVFRAIEYHTIERQMTREEFAALRNGAIPITTALDAHFRDDFMPDSDIETVEWQLDEWKIVK